MGPAATAAATASIPPAMLTLYQQAATTCPGLPWTVLAAIGTIESDNGQSALPGVQSGANSAGAEGPMQFEPATFAAYDEPVPPGGADPPSPYDPTDAVYAAARMLCANGAANGADLAGAIESYNHSSSYVAQVLALAQSYGGTTASLVPTGSSAGVVAAEWAMQQIGTPYVWGGETQGVGFDCSGLVQAAYRAAGVALPRVAQNQYDATAKVLPCAARARGPRLLRQRPGRHRPCGPLCRRAGRVERHGRCALHRGCRAGRAVPDHSGCRVREPALRGCDEAIVITGRYEREQPGRWLSRPPHSGHTSSARQTGLPPASCVWVSASSSAQRTRFSLVPIRLALPSAVSVHGRFWKGGW